MKALFILKQKTAYDSNYSEYSATGTTQSTYTNDGYLNYQAATGMWTSSQMVVDVLRAHSIPADLTLAEDSNKIDSIVSQSNPETVFIEGLWVTPAKFEELFAIPRHQSREWIVRIHSDMPFLATEGVAFSWIKQYLDLGVKIAPNSTRLYRELKVILSAMGYSNSAIDSVLVFLPNCYPVDFPTMKTLDLASKDTLDIACFGAVRVMKNHLMQAFNALEFCKLKGKKLRWHFNNNVGAGGVGPYQNMVSLMSGIPDVELVPHEWEDRETFLESLSNIDILLQISLSETMNIVAADATFVGVPIVVSDEISWTFPLYGHPTISSKTINVMETIYSKPTFFVNANREGLRSYAQTSEVIWVRKFLPQLDNSQIMSSPTIIPTTINNCCN